VSAPRAGNLVVGLKHLGASLWRGEVGAGTLLPPELRGSGWDKWLVLATFALVLLGLTMVYSATSVTASRPTAYLENQGFKVFLGVLAFAAGFRIDYHRWGRWAPWAYVSGLVMLLLVYVPGLGHSAAGARRWLSIGGITLQPADFARLGLVVYLAFLLSKPRARLERFQTGLLPCLIALGLMCVLVVKQPNLSTTLALIWIAGLMLVAGRIPFRHLAFLTAPVAGAMPFILKSYQFTRLVNFRTFWFEGGDLRDGNYQLYQSILAIGSGGWWGRGLGESRQKWFFLPDAHTDFIFAIIGEELGLIGAVLLIGLFMILLWRAYEAARRAPDRFGSLLAVGIGATVAVYAGVNLLVATGLFPTTGLPLPLVSYGGSAVLVMLFSLGILGNIASQGDSTLLVGIGEQD
jgi:cell division protein FtsW